MQPSVLCPPVPNYPTTTTRITTQQRKYHTTPTRITVKGRQTHTSTYPAPSRNAGRGLTSGTVPTEIEQCKYEILLRETAVLSCPRILPDIC